MLLIVRVASFAFNRALGDLAAYVNHVVPVVAHQFALNGYEVRIDRQRTSCVQPINVLLEPVRGGSGIRGIGLACRAPAQRRFRRALRVLARLTRQSLILFTGNAEGV